MNAMKGQLFYEKDRGSSAPESPLGKQKSERGRGRIKGAKGRGIFSEGFPAGIVKKTGERSFGG